MSTNRSPSLKVKLYNNNNIFILLNEEINLNYLRVIRSRNPTTSEINIS